MKIERDRKIKRGQKHADKKNACLLFVLKKKVGKQIFCYKKKKKNDAMILFIVLISNLLLAIKYEIYLKMN